MYFIWTYFCKNAKEECVAIYTHRHMYIDTDKKKEN